MRKLSLLFALIYLLFYSSVGFAAQFQINFSGEVESLTIFGVPGAPTLETVFNIFDPVTGTIFVDTDSLAPTTISSFVLTIGSYTASASSGTTFLRNDNMAGSQAPIVDSIVFFANSNITSTPIDGFSVDILQFAVGTENLSVLDASSVVGPTEILNLWADTPNYFSGNLNYMSFGNSLSDDETARFALTSVTVSPVPEPSTIFLLSAGLMGLGVFRRRFTA